MYDDKVYIENTFLSYDFNFLFKLEKKNSSPTIRDSLMILSLVSLACERFIFKMKLSLYLIDVQIDKYSIL